MLAQPLRKVRRVDHFSLERNSGTTPSALSFKVLSAVLLLLFILSPAAQAAENWIDLTASLEASGAGKSVRPIEIDPRDGTLFVLFKNSLWTSTDQGQSWQQMTEAKVQGAYWYALSLSYDPQTGGLAAFMKDPPEDPWNSVFRPSADAPWQPFTRVTSEESKRFNYGWSWGDIHWTGQEPRRMLGRMHHSERIWLSTDAGQTWDELAKTSIFFGFTPDGAILVHDEKAKTLLLSTDTGATWETVAEDLQITGRKPVIHEGRIYWVVQNGLIRSDNNGRTWQTITADLPDAFWGPYFGLTPDDLIVVTLQGVFRSADAGQSWTRVAGNRARELAKDYGTEKFRWDWFIGQTDWAWDAKNHLLYVAHGRLEQLDLTQAIVAQKTH